MRTATALDADLNVAPLRPHRSTALPSALLAGAPALPTALLAAAPVLSAALLAAATTLPAALPAAAATATAATATTARLVPTAATTAVSVATPSAAARLVAPPPSASAFAAAPSIASPAASASSVERGRGRGIPAPAEVHGYPGRRTGPLRFVCPVHCVRTVSRSRAAKSVLELWNRFKPISWPPCLLVNPMKAKGGRSPAKNDGSPTEEALARYVENPCTHTTTRRRRLVLYPIVAFPSFPPLSLERSFPYPLIVSILTRCRARRPRRPIPHPRITDFQPPHTVLRVDLSCQVGGDKLRSIGGLYSFTNLRDLNLSGNSITKVENLDHLVQLESLNLARNRIRRIEPTCGLEMFAKLRRLDLSGNFLQVRRLNRGRGGRGRRGRERK